MVERWSGIYPHRKRWLNVSRGLFPVAARCYTYWPDEALNQISAGRPTTRKRGSPPGAGMDKIYQRFAAKSELKDLESYADLFLTRLWRSRFLGNGYLGLAGSA